MFSYLERLPAYTGWIVSGGGVVEVLRSLNFLAGELLRSPVKRLRVRTAPFAKSSTCWQIIMKILMLYV